MNMRNFAVLIMLTIAVVCCNDDFELQNEEKSQLVVEGWIERGKFPVVILTRTFPVSTEYQSMDDLSDYVVRWAKVTVSDGTDSVVLTGKFDKGYFPPYIYTTGRLRGVAGRHYTLTVEYRDYHATARTFIPATSADCAFRVEPCTDSDTLFQIKAKFRDNPTEKNYYQFFTRVGIQTKQFQASYLGTLDDAVIDSVTETPVYRGRQFSLQEYTPYFSLGDTVAVKLAHIDETSFRIWDCYTKTKTLSSNLFLSTSEDIETNIRGGYGYWCGYNAVTDYIVIRDSIK